MINVLISCAGGFSSSLVISKLKKAAQNQNIEVNAWAINCGDIDENISKADILFVAPQIQYMYAEFKQKSDALGIPCILVDQKDYGRADGEHLLEIVQREVKK